MRTRDLMGLLVGALLLSLLISPALAAPRRAATKPAVPDLTRGDRIPEDSPHDWTLGATGARGWTYSYRLSTADAQQIAVTAVAKGSPADGQLQVGDVIVGVGGRPFSSNARIEFAKALTLAESEAGAGVLALSVWRAGKSSEIELRIPVLGAYSDTAPYNCPKSQRILELGCEAIAKHMTEKKHEGSPITRSLNGLALLASGEKKYLPLVEKEVRWAQEFSADGFATWYYGYVIMFLSEYKMSTGDETVMPGLRRLALQAANGQSLVGSWGHKFAAPDGNLYGYGMMNAPGLPLTVSLVMAREAGVSDPAIDRAIERSAKFLRFYAGKGSVPYGDHAPWIQTSDDNGKNSSAAVLFDLLDESEASSYFSRMSLSCYGEEREMGHTGNLLNIIWAMPGISRSGPNATGAWMREYGQWYFDLARGWDGRFVHQGPAQDSNDKYHGWDTTGGYLLAYALPLKKLWLTGKRPTKDPQVSAAEARQTIDDGAGWTNEDRYSFYDAMDRNELLRRLSSWSPVVRDRAGIAISRKEVVSTADLINLLNTGDLYARLGACQTLEKLGGKAAPAVPSLRQSLRADDLWLRVKAADALAAIGAPANVALPELLRMIVRGPTPQDPRGMEQRFLCFDVFDKMLKKSIDGVDVKLLRQAIVEGLKNEDGRARSSMGHLYGLLTYDQIKPLLPVIYDTTRNLAPSGEMFAAGIRMAGLKLLVKHRIKEAMPLCFDVMDFDRTGKNARVPECLALLAEFGPAAKEMLPRLRELETFISNHWEAKTGLKPALVATRELIKKLENTSGTIELNSLRNPD